MFEKTEGDNPEWTIFHVISHALCGGSTSIDIISFPYSMKWYFM
jgi:hypothetical protein